ncbi:MAG: aldehyde dehydrogenase family protein [Bifidobacteriaceae bacterium]|jgi:aldehyde dehydrogenase (NAD+)|nr:aldehyde dehydrogenase family protein [Bifidobacteriaceae bacterium]
MKQYTKQYIGGEWREGTGDAVLQDFNPATGELLFEYRAASTADVDAAYAAAKAAQPAWAATPPAAKRQLLLKLAQVVEEYHDELISIFIEEAGSAAHKYGFEYGGTFDAIAQASHYPYMMDGLILPSDIPGKENYVWRSPKGVILTIAPFNFPFLLAIRSVVPAVATGNTVVLKPASDTPASAFVIGELFEKAGFPPGVINVIAGRGSDIGDYIVTHPVPSLVSFTGSSEVGGHIGALATGLIKDVSLELGGNNTMIILDDADVQQACAAAVFGAYCHQGQVCMALNRIVCLPGVYDQVVETFTAMAAGLPVGQTSDPNVFVGPIINASQVKKIEALIAQTIAEGATVSLEGHTEGAFIHPWVLSDVTNDMTAAKQECFGPVVSIMRAKDEAEAIAIANDTEYGLSNSVFTSDLYHGMQVARQMDSGMVHVNDQSINDESHVMFGGEKASGVGRFNARWVVGKFTTEKWISVQVEPRF